MERRQQHESLFADVIQETTETPDTANEPDVTSQPEAVASSGTVEVNSKDWQDLAQQYPHTGIDGLGGR